MNVKVMGLMRRAAGLSREEFFHRYLRDHAPRVVYARPQLGAYVINLVNVSPEEAGLRGAGEPAFDAVSEAWFDSLEDFRAGAAVDRDLFSDAYIYLVAEKVERDYERAWSVGQRSPGVKSIFLARRREDMTRETFAEYWGQRHAPLALKHHLGMWRYVRNLVQESLTTDAPDWDGFAVLHFRTAEDLRERFYDSEAGRELIAADVARFSSGGRALHCSEYVIKA
jgi:uncharacterized protein (TIGR02118 family)